MMAMHINISGSGTYLPKRTVLSKEIDLLFGKPDGWTQEKSGLVKRSFAKHETSSYMGAQAALNAIENSTLAPEDIDCIISACGVMEQAIPVTGVLIKNQLGLDSDIPCFDINLTCISFMVALDIASLYIQSGRYHHILLVSSEMPSKGINPECIETYPIFGDGAAAVIVSKPSPAHHSQIIDVTFKNHLEGIDYCQLQGAGTKFNPIHEEIALTESYYFKMDGKKIFKLSSQLVPNFVFDFLRKNHISIDDLALIVPHQASNTALNLMRKKLGAREDQFYNIIATIGNQMSASIPYALHTAIKDKAIQRGDLVLLLGTAAGLSLGSILLRY